MNFKEKVQAMSAKEIIMAMVEGLRNPVTKIRMNTYGGVRNDICYGCAATNTICKIANLDVDYLISKRPIGTMTFIFSDHEKYDEQAEFIDEFENAINYLRSGEIEEYNYLAEKIQIGLINPIVFLPELTDEYTEEELLEYVKLANFQDEN